MEQFLHMLGYGLCHQLPERSFEAAGFIFPVCARDTGIYIGLIAGLLVMALIARSSKSSALPPVRSMLLLSILFLPFMIDGATSYLGLRETTNLIRVITGLCAGYGAGTLLYPVFAMSLGTYPETRQPLASPKAVLLWLLAGTILGGIYLLILNVVPVLALALLVGAIPTAFVLINATLILFLASVIRESRHDEQEMAPFSKAFIVTVFFAAFIIYLLEMTGVASLKHALLG